MNNGNVEFWIVHLKNALSNDELREVAEAVNNYLEVKQLPDEVKQAFKTLSFYCDNSFGCEDCALDKLCNKMTKEHINDIAEMCSILNNDLKINLY